MMQSDDEALWSTEMEIEAQHYFQPIFERLRVQPDDTLRALKALYIELAPRRM